MATKNPCSSSVPTQQLWENPATPYFLQNSDNPNMPLVCQPLNEENYNTWSRSVLVALDAKTKIGFIDGSISKP